MKLRDEIMEQAEKLVKRLRIKCDDLTVMAHEGNRSCGNMGYLCQRIKIADIPELKYDMLMELVGAENADIITFVLSRPEDGASMLRLKINVDAFYDKVTTDFVFGMKGPTNTLLRSGGIEILTHLLS